MTRIILDTETTGLNAALDEVLQLAIIDADTGDILLNRRYGTTLLREWPAAEAVNHISPAAVEDLPPLSHPYEQTNAAEIIGGADWIGGWNINFDLSMLYGYQIAPRDDAKVVDVMQIDADFCGRIIPARDGQGYEVKWRKLKDAATFWGFLPLSGDYHDALTDCLATREVLRAIRLWHEADWNKNNRFKYIEARDYLRDIMKSCSEIQAEMLAMMCDPDDVANLEPFEVRTRLQELGTDMKFCARLLEIASNRTGMSHKDKVEMLREALDGKIGVL